MDVHPTPPPLLLVVRANAPGCCLKGPPEASLLTDPLHLFALFRFSDLRSFCFLHASDTYLPSSLYTVSETVESSTLVLLSSGIGTLLHTVVYAMIREHVALSEASAAVFVVVLDLRTRKKRKRPTV